VNVAPLPTVCPLRVQTRAEMGAAPGVTDTGQGEPAPGVDLDVPEWGCDDRRVDDDVTCAEAVAEPGAAATGPTVCETTVAVASYARLGSLPGAEVVTSCALGPSLFRGWRTRRPTTLLAVTVAVAVAVAIRCW
jgi:hypothetical protein